MEGENSADHLVEGLYDAVQTEALDEAVAESAFRATLKKLGADEEVHVLSRHVMTSLTDRLAQVTKPEQRLKVVNDVLDRLGLPRQRVTSSQRLVALRRPEQLGVEARYPDPPVTPLGQPALLTNTTGEPALGTEIRSELASADRVDLLCAFIKWHGLRTLEKELRTVARRKVPLRVITTTYMGATDRRAVDRLVRDFGAEVKVNYEVERTRLHAKAWLFERNTTYDTAYVGSSNLSKTALLDGVEWNVRLTSIATPHLLRKFKATFDTYWHDPAFELYDPEKNAGQLDEALAEAGGGGSGRATITLSGLEVRPYPHQVQMLEELSVEREVHDRHRNLLVAATGTGKTVIAALDYKRLAESAGRRPALLFIAHRTEILEQARRTYREVLGDAGFGELYIAGERPTEWTHVFASIQSFQPRTLEQFDPGQFEIVVIDEFHHAEAASYQRVMQHFRPVELLGLTATPERADGVDVRKFFDYRVASELRLWDALAADLLVPFHYFAVADGTDLSHVAWTRGRYDPSPLEDLFTGNDARARIVLNELHDKVSDVLQMRALGFCMGVRHAVYMARVFNEAGIPALALSGHSRKTERSEALGRLSRRKVNVIFTADLYNEGVDVPDVDTVLFLRPTESPTIFLQQLGRGLRRARDKAVLTALDFVGNHNTNFRFDQRFTALTGIPRGHLKRAIQQKFPFLPSGSQIILDRQSEALVLENLARQVFSNWRTLVSRLRDSGDVTLAVFIDAEGLELSDILRSHSWTEARRAAGLPTRAGGAHETALLRRIKSVAHVDDRERYDAYRALLADNSPAFDALDPRSQRYASMLLFSLWPSMPFASIAEAAEALANEPAVRDELVQVLEIAFSRVKHIARPLKNGLALTPLRSHAHYNREELMAGLGEASLTRKPGDMREGVLYARALNTDAFLITLTKDASSFSPSTMYRDYALSPTQFHWESQSTTRAESPTGTRYINHRENGSHILLFVRNSGANAFGKGAPYLLLGTANYLSHRSEQPIEFVWQLDRPMPEDSFLQASIEAG